MAEPTRHEQHQDAARQRWGRATPYRLGVIVGEAGDGDLPCPYAKGSKGAAAYFAGVRVGHVVRKARQATAGVKTVPNTDPDERIDRLLELVVTLPPRSMREARNGHIAEIHSIARALAAGVPETINVSQEKAG